MASTLLFVARAWAQLTSVVLLLVAGRYLDITAFGEFTLASSVALLLNQFMGVGTSEYVIRHPDKPEAASTAFWVNTLLAICYIAVGMGVAFGSGKIFRSNTVMTLVFLMIPLAWPIGVRTLGGAILVRDAHIGRQATTNLFVETVALAVGIAGLVKGYGVVSLVASRYVQGWVGAVLFLVAARWRPALQWSGEQAREMMRFWRSMIVDRGLGYFQNYGADLLLGAFMTPAAVAIYRMGARIVALLTTIIYDPMRTVNWRVLSVLHAREGTIVATAELIIGCLYLLLLGPILILGVTGGDLARLALGPQWEGVGTVILLLCIATLLALPQQMSEPAFGVVGLIKRLPLQRIMTISISLTLLLTLARYGPVSAALSQSLAACATLLVTILVQRRVVGLHPRNYLKQMGFALAAGLIAVGVVELVKLGTASLSLLARLPLMIGAGMAVYVALIYLFQRGPLLRLLKLVEVKPDAMRSEDASGEDLKLQGA